MYRRPIRTVQLPRDLSDRATSLAATGTLTRITLHALEVWCEAEERRQALLKRAQDDEAIRDARKRVTKASGDPHFPAAT